ANLGSATDADGDPITYAYQWYKNGQAIGGATAATLSLPGSGVRKGDHVTVKVTPGDGIVQGTTVTSAAVTVADSAPVIGSVNIVPSNPAVTGTLTANVVNPSDADGDAITYSYQWCKNGQAITGAT